MNSYMRDLEFDIVLPKIKADNINQVLHSISLAASRELNIQSDKLHLALKEKEANSSSAIGDGVAIPHLQTTGVKRRATLFATLDRAIDMNAIDHEPVDIIAFVLSPQSEGATHLRRLSRISRFLKNHELNAKLHEATDEQSLRAILANPEGWLLAA